MTDEELLSIITERLGGTWPQGFMDPSGAYYVLREHDPSVAGEAEAGFVLERLYKAGHLDRKYSAMVPGWCSDTYYYHLPWRGFVFVREDGTGFVPGATEDDCRRLGHRATDGNGSIQLSQREVSALRQRQDVEWSGRRREGLRRLAVGPHYPTAHDEPATLNK